LRVLDAEEVKPFVKVTFCKASGAGSHEETSGADGVLESLWLSVRDASMVGVCYERRPQTTAAMCSGRWVTPMSSIGVHVALTAPWIACDGDVFAWISCGLISG
jgi:hypothetical protein